MTALSLDESPPLSAPLRFFLSAPAHAIAAGVVVSAAPGAVTASRWTGEALAVVHLLALGFLTQVTCGALLQLLPVAVGAAVPRVRLAALSCHLGLNLGTGLLVAAFLGAGRGLFVAAGAVLLFTLLSFSAAAALSLARSRAIGPTLPVLRLAVASLAVTAGLGFTLALGLGLVWSAPIATLVPLHAAWGLLGFALSLLAGVAYLVVPMFQLTPAYPVPLARAVPWAVGLGLAGWTVGGAAGLPEVALAGAAALASVTVAFVAQTLLLQAASKRRVRDTTVWAWRLGLACLLLATAPASALSLGRLEGWRAPLEYVTGVLLLVGAFPSFISGMLYKIVPFLVWLHRSRAGPGAPLMHQVIGEPGPRGQLVAHAASLALLVAGAVWPAAASLGGALFAASQAVLALNLAVAISVYRAAGRARPVQGLRSPAPRGPAVP